MIAAEPRTQVTSTGRVCLFGAAPDTGNLGVSALLEATLVGLFRRLPELAVTVFDNGLGERPGRIHVAGRQREYRRRGARIGRRYWRPEHLWNMRVRAWLGPHGPGAVRDIDEATAVVDLSGGDSFTDLYGRSRLAQITLPKLVALERGTPLVLLPQTYGPFSSRRTRRLARSILRRTTMSWARDPDSAIVMRDLLGEDVYDPARHRTGVDVAFLLEPRRPSPPVAESLEHWLANSDGPVVGLGVSGLLHNEPAAAGRFGLVADYPRVVSELAVRLLAQDGVRLVLVPHVRGTGVESDDRACAALVGWLEPRLRERVLVLPPDLDAGEAKWLISHLDWYCGTRMHSTIAALSSEVPACAIAYSAKTRGVFATCRQERWVADARRDSTAEIIDRMWQSWQNRAKVAADLREHLGVVRTDAERQMDAIAAVCAGSVAPPASTAIGQV